SPWSRSSRTATACLCAPMTGVVAATVTRRSICGAGRSGPSGQASCCEPSSIQAARPSKPCGRRGEWAMSQENVEIAKRSIEALAAGGAESALAFVARDSVWYAFPEWVEESAFRGHDGFRRMAALFADMFDDFALRIEEFREFGDRVVELGEMTGRIK